MKENIDKQVRYILDTRHTVPLGQSHTDTYAPRIVEWHLNHRQRDLEKLAFHTGIPVEDLEGFLRAKENV